MAYKIIRDSEFRAALGALGTNIKKGTHVVDALPQGYRVDAVVVDRVVPHSEIHEHGRDIWYVVAGAGEFILGGTVTNPERKREGEISGDGIEGGERITVGPGDVIDIDPGTAHQICSNERLELFLVKLEPAAA